VPASEADGPSTAIRAHVRARLLGLRLLTLDARIDLGPPGPWADAPEVLPARRVRTRIHRPVGPVGNGLRRATLLLTEGDERLARARNGESSAS